MKNKIIIVSVAIITIASLSGCGMIPQLPEMTQEQETLITEYAAGLLLKYDKAYDNGLLSEEELSIAEAKEIERLEKAKRQKQLAEEYVAKSEKAREEKEKEKADKKEKDNKTEDIQTESAGPLTINENGVAEFMQIEDTGISYLGYETKSSYADNNSAFSIDASNGNKLIVAKFKITNTSSNENEIDLFSKPFMYMLSCADGSLYSNCNTWLEDDLSIYKNKLKSNAGEETVLLFEIPEGKDIAGAVIQIIAETDMGVLNL